MKVAMITDGNSHLGMGHIYQSITFSGFLSQRLKNNAIIFFMTKSDEAVVDLLSTQGFPVFSYANDDEIFNKLVAERPEIIIFDKLDVSPELAQKIKSNLDSRLVIMTNLTEANNFADITVLADIGSNFQNIVKRHDITGQVQFFGPKYWILRPEFYEYRKRKKEYPGVIKNIMLIFGGSDPANVSSAVLRKLLQMDAEFAITLVLGASFANIEEINSILSRQNSRSKVSIARGITNVAEVMYNSDVVFASPGLSFFESLAVGTPVLGFHQDELQRVTYENYLPTLDKSETWKLDKIIEDKSFIYPEDAFVASMEIGEGKDEIINQILS